MSIALISDTHITSSKPFARTDSNFVENIRAKLNGIVKICIENDVTVLLHAGDLTNSPIGWENYLLVSEFANSLKSNDIQLITVFGQHDMRHRNRSGTILQALVNSGRAMVASHNPIFISLSSKNSIEKIPCRIFGASYGEETPKFELIEHSNYYNILIIHKEIFDGKATGYKSNWLEAKTFLKKNKIFDIILTGDIHNQFFIKDGSEVILNCGTMARLSINEFKANHKPHLYILNDKIEFKKVFIPAIDVKELFSVDRIEAAERVESSKEQLKELLNNSIQANSEYATFDEGLIFLLSRDDIPDEVKGELSTAYDEMKGK